jgi:hypothetical protein
MLPFFEMFKFVPHLRCCLAEPAVRSSSSDSDSDGDSASNDGSSSDSKRSGTLFVFVFELVFVCVVHIRSSPFFSHTVVVVSCV